jgi:hypothetical protein
MKEILLALMLGIALCYEIITFIKARSYVRTFYVRSKQERDENDKTVQFGIGCFSLIYMIFLVLGMALSSLWFIYLAIFIMSIIQSPVNRYLKRKKYWEVMVQFKRLDSIISIAILTCLFFAHFHPEVIEWIW